MKLRKGFLVVIEGIDGAGKTTQAKALLRKLRAAGYPAAYFREPSRGRWGREIKRKALRADSLTPSEELDLFLKDRQENVHKNLGPALNQNKVVVLDRYYFSTMAYQGAKGLDPERIRRMNERFAPRPDLVFILDIGARRGLSRIQGRRTKDRLFERERYLARVRRIFRGLRGRTFVHLEATRPREEILSILSDRVFRSVRALERRRKPRPVA